MLETWLLGFVVAFVILQFLAFLYLQHVRSRLAIGGEGDANPATDSESEPVGAADGTVVCEECGAENEAEYRFCAHCVSELPGGTEVGRKSRSPASGRLM